MRYPLPLRGRLRTLVMVALLLPALSCHNVEGPEAELDAFEFPIALALHPDGQWLYVASSNFEGRFQDRRGGALHVVNTDTMEVEGEGSLRIPSFAGALALGTGEAPESIFVGLRGPGRILALRLDDEGAAVRCSEGDDGAPCAISSLPRDVFDLIAVEPPADMTLEQDVQHVAVASLGGQVTLVSIPEGRPTDATRNSRRLLSGLNTLHYPTPGGPLYAGARFERGIHRVDWVLDERGRAEGLYTSARIALPAGAGSLQESRGIILDASRDLLYVLTSRPGGVFVIDVSPDASGQARNRYLARIDLDGRPSAMRLVREESGDHLYVTLLDRDEIAVIELETRALVERIPVGVTPYGLVVDQVRHQRLYVALFEEHSVGVIDLNPENDTYRRMFEVIR